MSTGEDSRGAGKGIVRKVHHCQIGLAGKSPHQSQSYLREKEHVKGGERNKSKKKNTARFGRRKTW